MVYRKLHHMFNWRLTHGVCCLMTTGSDGLNGHNFYLLHGMHVHVCNYSKFSEIIIEYLLTKLDSRQLYCHCLFSVSCNVKVPNKDMAIKIDESVKKCQLIVCGLSTFKAHSKKITK